MKSSSLKSIAAQTEGDTGYDYNDVYDEDYEEESGMQTRRNIKSLFKVFGRNIITKTAP